MKGNKWIFKTNNNFFFSLKKEIQNVVSIMYVFIYLLKTLFIYITFERSISFFIV